MTSFDFRFSYRFPPDDFIANGAHTDALMKGLLMTMRENFDAISLSTDNKSKYRQFTQYSGSALSKTDKKPVFIICSFSKHRQSNYCIIFSVPKEFYPKARSRINWILSNVEELKM